MDPDESSLSREDFQIAIVCALPLEFDAVVAVLDHVYDESVSARLGKAPGDRNTYTHGRMKQHNVVIVVLKQRNGNATMGKANAAIVASDLRNSYYGLRLALLVGICGGVPKAGNSEVLLGDVIIGNSIVQYDFGRQFPDGFRRKEGAQNTLAAPMEENASILGLLASGHGKETVHVKTASFLAELQKKRAKYAFPEAASDRLYESSYRHKHQNARDCKCQYHKSETDSVCDMALEEPCAELGCDDSCLVKRSRLEERLAAPDGDAVFQPAIFVGGVATGDTVMKSGIMRDKVAKTEGIIGFEMEAAGVWEQLPTIVIKAVCDYADSHKNKKWQDYAAGTAAAAAKAVAMFHTPADKPRIREMKAAQPESILPFPPDPEFINRPEISNWLKEKARVDGTRVALVGLGGIGKSQLAIQYAHGVRNWSHVFWVNATTRATFDESFRAIADRLGLEKPGDSLDATLRRLGGWFGNKRNGRWTVVVDNFDDASAILREDDPRLDNLLPWNGTGFVLITSRTVVAAERLVGSAKGMVYSVPDLGEEAALELFQGKLERQCEKEEAQEVVRLLEFVPLAISQAAAYINRSAHRGVSVRDYADMFRAGDAKRKSLLEWEYDELRRYQGSANSVFGTWTITLEQMQQEKPSAVDLLSLMSFFSPQSIQERALEPLYMESIENYFPEFTFRDLMSPTATSFLSRTGFGRRFLNQTVDKGLISDMWAVWAKPEPEDKDAKEQGKAKAGHSTKKNKEKKKKSKKKSERKPGVTVMTRLARSWIQKASASSSDTDSDDNDSDSTSPADKLKQDLDILRKYSMITPTANDRVLKMHPLVRYCTQNWLSQSRTLDTWKKRFMMIMMVFSTSSLHLYEEDPSRNRELICHIEFLANEEPEDPATTRLWLTLCSYLNTRRWQERGSKDPTELLPLAGKMAAVADKILGPGNRLTIDKFAHLASIAFEQGQFERAEAIYKDVLRRCESVRLDYTEYVYQVQYARTLRAQGRLEECEKITAALAAEVAPDDAVLGDPRWERVAYCRAHHAETLAALGRFQEATEITVDLLQKDHLTNPQHLNFSHNIVCLTAVTKKMSEHSPIEEVEPLLTKILDAVDKVPGKLLQFSFNLCAPFYQHLAVCQEKQGDLPGAESALARGMKRMANALAFPRLYPPTLIGSLLEAPEDDNESRQRLMQGLLQNLDSEAGRFSVPFLWQIANIGRHLYVRGRADECMALLNALCRHMRAEWGENNGNTLPLVDFRDGMERWHIERCERAKKIEERNEKETAETIAQIDSALDLGSEDTVDGGDPETVKV